MDKPENGNGTPRVSLITVLTGAVSLLVIVNSYLLHRIERLEDEVKPIHRHQERLDSHKDRLGTIELRLFGRYLKMEKPNDEQPNE